MSLKLIVCDGRCSVCLGDYQAEDRLQHIPACGHTFHMDCIDLWLATHTTCPLCRKSLLASTKAPITHAVPDTHLETNSSSTCDEDAQTSRQQSSESLEGDERVVGPVGERERDVEGDEVERHMENVVK